MRGWWRFLPALLLAGFLVAAIWRLTSPPDVTVRSRMTGKPVPEFALASPLPSQPALASSDLAGGAPKLVNIFASWCVPCIAEAPVLEDLKRKGARIDGIAIRDTPGALGAFLDRHGNPYDRIGSDENSSVQLALGSSGVPETFIVDGKGVIRFQHIGPIKPEDVAGILAKLEEVR